MNLVLGENGPREWNPEMRPRRGNFARGERSVTQLWNVWSHEKGIQENSPRT